MHDTFRLLAMSTVLFAPLPMQTPVQVAPFSAIDLPHGGHVALRPGTVQRVSLIRGSLDYTRFNVSAGGVLVVDKCSRKCPRGYRLEVEITTPGLSRVSFANGGVLQSRGSFPRQAELTVAVAHGGTVDVRSMVAQRVTASVEHGGRILTVPQTSLFAKVTQGGVITYWGQPQVRSSIEHGGVVAQGILGEIDLPLSEIGQPVLPHHTKVGRGR